MRYTWVDYAKVICILLMVICHAGLKGMGDNIIYQFHMPAFFIISGYLFRPKGLKKELLSFGIPLLFYGAITLLYRYARIFIANGLSVSDCVDTWSAITISALRSFYIASTPSLFQGCWFVIVLWMMRISMESHLMQRIKLWIAIVCIVYCCVEPYIQVPELLYQLRVYHMLSSLPFFITGMYLRDKKFDVMQGKFELKLLLLIVFFSIILVQGRVDLYKYHYGVSYAVMYLNALIGSYLLFNVCNCLPKRNWVELYSTGTLLILGVHGIIYHLINDFLEHFHAENFYYAVFIGVAVMLICYYPIKWFNKVAPPILGKVH